MQRKVGYTIDEVTSGQRFVEVFPGSKPWHYSYLEEDSRLFSFETYAKEIHSPVEVLTVDLSSLEALRLPRCLDMPLRLAGETVYKLPWEWEALGGLLSDIIALEHEHNPSWRDYNSYLTVDLKEVEAGEQQRHGGLHVDGFQGERIEEKTKVTRSYVATSNGGTTFYPQRFVCADPKIFNVFEGFELQGDTMFQAKEGSFYFMDAYAVHEAGFAARSGLRLFLRLTFDLKRFDRLGNTHNAALAYDWPMFDRSVASELRRPKLTDIVDSPYFPRQ